MARVANEVRELILAKLSAVKKATKRVEKVVEKIKNITKK